MLKADFAELILSMTLPAGPAASIAGDLEEEATLRGSLWFWITLLRTSASASWRALVEAPFRLAFWGLAGFAWQFLCSMAIGGVVALILRFPVFDGTLPEAERQSINLILTTVGVAFQFGKWLARNVPYRELPVYAIASIPPHLVIWLVTIWIQPPAYGYSGWIVGALAAVIGPIFTLAGVKRGRTLAYKR